MDAIDDLSRFCCLNPQCELHGLRDHGNIIFVAYYGKARYRLLRCTRCKQRFSERKGTPLFGNRLPEEKALAVLQHLQEGCGVRATSRLVGVSRKAVTRYALRAGEHARHIHSERVCVSPLHPGNPIRRKVGIRRQKATAVRSGRSRR
jgi:transposase-like protein